MTKEDQLIQALLQHRTVVEAGNDSSEDVSMIQSYEAAMRSNVKLVSSLALLVRQVITNRTQEGTTFNNLKAHINA